MMYHEPVFGELYDAISYLWSFLWPKVTGEITAVDVERNDRLTRLAVAYKFRVNDDGPYTGESFWNPPFNLNRRVREARGRFVLDIRCSCDIEMMTPA